MYVSLAEMLYANQQAEVERDGDSAGADVLPQFIRGNERVGQDARPQK